MPRTNVPHPSAKETDHDWYERWHFRMAFVGFWILLFGACVGYRTLGQLQEQTSALQQQVFAGSRAYLLVRNVRIETDGALAPGSKLRLLWETVNVGQTPAHNLRTSYAIYIGPPASDPPSDRRRGYSEARVLGPSDVEQSPDVFGVWLDDQPGRELQPKDSARLKAGEVLNARIIVAYDTVFEGVTGITSVCAYYEGSRFSYCGLRGTQIQ